MQINLDLSTPNHIVHAKCAPFKGVVLHAREGWLADKVYNLLDRKPIVIYPLPRGDGSLDAEAPYERRVDGGGRSENWPSIE